MKKRIEKWLKETMAIACLLLIAMPMTASKKAAIFVLQALLSINFHIPPHSRRYSTFYYSMVVKG